MLSEGTAPACPAFLSDFNDRLVPDLCGVNSPLTERKADDDVGGTLLVGATRRSNSATTELKASIRRAAVLGSKVPPSNMRRIGMIEPSRPWKACSSECTAAGFDRERVLWARLRQPQDDVAMCLARIAHLAEPIDELAVEGPPKRWARSDRPPPISALIDALADKEEEVLKAAAQGLKRIQGKEIGERE